MKPARLDEEEIFHVAKGMPERELRDQYLDQVCEGDSGLKERVEKLLEVYEAEQSFLMSANDPPDTQQHVSIIAKEGQQIGRFKLLQKIGEGGFGVVYMAEQSKPVRRKVALKIIKPGMDTGEIVGRFEAERQALAMMDHPNIARVFDGGATESGRPYFVMELVKGVPITEYCDKNQLNTTGRLKLFVTVCQAVQHAHQKGIIHRDLKPSNILVTLHDGKPVVKVIDFGVAKATNQQLTEKTLFTAFGQMVGTPQYMSPEQAEMSGLDIDTRSDVYSLGVLLYELLTGTTPLEAENLRQAGYVEMQKLILETEPPKPSNRLSTSGDQLTIVAKHRSISPDGLQKVVSGDLDWIVMTALEKDRNRRYASTNDLAQDVDNYLTNEPIKARSPSVIYRTRKFLRRNRVFVATASIVALTLVCGLGLSLVGMYSANKSARRAQEESERANILLKQNLDLAVREVMLKSFEGEVEPVLKLIEKYQPLFDNRGIASDENWPTILEASAYLHAGEINKAIELLMPIVESSSKESSIPTLAILSTSLLHRGDWNRPIKLANRLNGCSPRSRYPDIDQLFLGYGKMFVNTRDAVHHINQTLERNPNWLICHTLLADALIHEGNFKGNPEMTEKAHEVSSAILKLVPDNPFALNTSLFSHKCMIELRQKQAQPYEELERKGKELAKRFQNRCSNYPLAQAMAAQFYEAIGDRESAETSWLAALRIGEETWQWTALGALYRTKSATEMLKLIDQNSGYLDTRWSRLAKGYILADSTDGHEAAMKIFEEAVKEELSMMDRYTALQIPLLLGRKDIAMDWANKWIGQSRLRAANESRSEFGEVDIFRVVASDGQYTPVSENTRLTESLTNYWRGLLAISDGKSRHSDAIKFLEKSAEGPFGWVDPYWARSFVAHLKRDKNWPQSNPN